MIIPHPTFKDNRGSFTAVDTKFNDEIWNQVNVVTNQNKYTFRGLHYQTNPPQTKCIKVIQGAILDVLYNLETKEVQVYHLDDTKFLYVSDEYAHGYLTLEPNTIVTYLVRGEYNPKSEHSIVWDTIPNVKKIIEDTLMGSNIWISDKDRVGK
tara:strand:+ start:21 stop:479 length:459 start_codon:yes stop_codon:yes gene_type:complete